MHLAPALCLFPFTTVVAIKKIQFLRCVIDFLDPNRTLSPHSALSRSGLVRRHLLLCLFTPNKSSQRVRSVLWASLYPPQNQAQRCRCGMLSLRSTIPPPTGSPSVSRNTHCLSQCPYLFFVQFFGLGSACLSSPSFFLVCHFFRHLPDIPCCP